MGHGKRGFASWGLLLKLVQRFKARHARKYRNLKEEEEVENNTENTALLNQRYSSTNEYHSVDTGAPYAVFDPLPGLKQCAMPEVSHIEKKLMKLTTPHLDLEQLAPTKLAQVPELLPSGPFSIPSEGGRIRSSESAQNALAVEVSRLENILGPDNPFRTAAVLREAVVGLGTLTRRLNDLIVTDPGVVECATDVEMLVRRAGELFGSLREFASHKGIPVKEDAAECQARSRSNPELFFEDDAPWLRSGCLSRSSEDSAWSEAAFSTGSFIRSCSMGGCLDIPIPLRTC